MRYKKTNNDPWLLVSSLTPIKNLAEIMVKICKLRMQIEENIRDSKSHKFGFSLNDSRTRKPEKMSILLLVAAIASLICWCAGIFTQQSGLRPKFQASSAKFECKLSLVFLGKEALKKGLKMILKQFMNMLKILRSIGIQVYQTAS